MLAPRILVFAAPFILLQGCSTAPDTADVAPAAFLAAAPSNTSGTAAVPGALYPGDLLEVSVFQVPDLNREVQVDGAGQISLPLVGELKAAGKTPRTLEAEIATKLKAKYLQSPQVTVFLKKADGEQVSVTGEVNKPGIFSIAGRMSLVQALAQAGDIDQVGDPSNVLVLRQANGSRIAAKFNVDDIRSGKAPDPDLLAGDMVVVDGSGSRSFWKGAKDLLPGIGTIGSVAAYSLK